MRFLLAFLRRLPALAVLLAALLLGIENVEALSKPLRFKVGFPGTESLGTADIPTVFFCLAFFLLGLVAACLGRCPASEREPAPGQDTRRSASDPRFRGPMP